MPEPLDHPPEPRTAARLLGGLAWGAAVLMLSALQWSPPPAPVERPRPASGSLPPSISGAPRRGRGPAAAPGMSGGTVATPGNLQGRGEAMADATATTEARLRAVEALLLTGATRSAVLAHAAAEWRLATRSADRLLALARRRIRESWDLDRAEVLAALLSQLATLQQEARARGDLAVALGALNLQARLCRLI